MKNKNRIYSKIGQLLIVIFLAVFMILNFYAVSLIQGTGRVINYAGIVRGATQRLVKLEIVEQPNDELILYLDEIIRNLQYGGGLYNLSKLEDKEYTEKLSTLANMWDLLKVTINEYRIDSNKEDELLESSEEYFTIADEVVSIAEVYSESKAKWMRIYEVLLFLGIVLLIIISFKQTLYEIHLTRRNKELSVAAYLDKLTGIPGRRSCEEALWYPADLKNSPHCVVMFDLNNLKQLNDTLGHQYGDKLIKAFADILVKFANDKVFVGRFGGDEFLFIIRDYEEEMVIRLLEEVQKEVDEHNRKISKFKIEYASGYEYNGESILKMLEKADEKMYFNKKMMKEAQSKNITGN